MLTVATLLWDANRHSAHFSRMYTEEWAVKLYNGFARNLTVPWRFVLFTDRLRDLPDGILQERIKATEPDYCTCIEPFRYGVPMILCGLDTVVVGSCDHLASYCLTHDQLALPRDPNRKEQSCNGVALIPKGFQHVYRNQPAGLNDMLWLRKQENVAFIDDLFPGQVVSYKGHVKKHGLEGVKICYFHGNEKPHEIDEPWLKQHWT